ncbi:MAG TPA: ATP-binding cassette domain-containing protein [Puia sp.]|nr:ATP-binding cassette domain-containing protein [Puia sp.]
MIELENISKVFNRGEANEVAALRNINLRIEKGEFAVIVGANGSGKTTLLNILAGAEKASDGHVILGGKDVTGLAEYKRSKWIARVFQNPYTGTASDLSILDNFRLAALRTQPKKLVIGIDAGFKQRVRDMIAKLGMGLENKIDLLMGSLSGGQRQALTLLMSVMDTANILLLDEPTAALDPKSSALILNLADRLIKEFHLTALCITHNLKYAHQYGSRLIQFQEGGVLRDYHANQKGALSLQDMFGWFE